VPPSVAAPRSSAVPSLPAPRAEPRSGALPNGEWVNQTGSSGPPPRYGSSMAYDAALHEVILFGGCGLAICPENDTWAFAGGTWTQLQPNASPPARWAAMMAYDPLLSAVVLFGGCSNSTCLLNDTWEFSNGNWTPLPPGPAPPGRSAGSLVYDANGSRLLLFGGCFRNPDYNCADNSLWQLNATGVWSPLSPSGTLPVPRGYQAAATDPSVGGILIEGGSAFGLLYQTNYYWNDTWGFSGNTWTNFTEALPPAPCCSSSAAWDNATQSVILFGGVGPGTGAPPVGSTWSFANGSWTNVTPSVSPSARWLASAAYDVADDEFLLYGGENQTSSGLGDTWVYRLAAFPAIGASPASGGVDAGEVATFTVPASAMEPNASYRWSGLPDCSAFNTAVLRCPTAASGQFPVEVNVSDPNGTSGATVPLLYTVLPAPSLGGLSTFPATVDAGQVVTFVASAAGGTGQYSYTWSLLPSGCASADSPQLQCTPNASGSFRPQLEVRDTNGGTSTALLPPVLVNGALTLSIAVSSTPALVLRAFTITATVHGGTSPVSLAWSAPPSGCTVVGAGSVSCNESAPTTVRLAVEARDSVGANFTQQVNVSVEQAPGTRTNGTPSGTNPGFLAYLEAYAVYIALGIAALLLLLFALVRRDRRPPEAPPEPEPVVESDEPPV
jgi:hypothetical protein